MSVRIRYRKVGEMYVSERAYKNFKVELSLANYSFKVLDATNSSLVMEGSGGSLAALKIKAKRALVGLGVKFEKEVRTKAGENYGPALPN